jgi:hypothetical protein
MPPHDFVQLPHKRVKPDGVGSGPLRRLRRGRGRPRPKQGCLAPSRRQKFKAVAQNTVPFAGLDELIVLSISEAIDQRCELGRGAGKAEERRPHGCRREVSVLGSPVARDRVFQLTARFVRERDELAQLHPAAAIDGSFARKGGPAADLGHRPNRTTFARASVRCVGGGSTMLRNLFAHCSRASRFSSM